MPSARPPPADAPALDDSLGAAAKFFPALEGLRSDVFRIEARGQLRRRPPRGGGGGGPQGSRPARAPRLARALEGGRGRVRPAMARRILGLDMGSHAVKAVELRQTLRELTLVQMRVLPVVGCAALPRRPSCATSSRPTTCRASSWSRASPATASRPGASRFPFKDRRKIRAALPFEVEAQVPFELDDYFVDFEIAAEAESRTDVVAALVPRAEVRAAARVPARGRARAAHRRGRGPRPREPRRLLPAARRAPPRRRRPPQDHASACASTAARWRRARCRWRATPSPRRSPAERGVGEVEAERRKIEQGVLGRAQRPSAAGDARSLDRLARELVRTVGVPRGGAPGPRTAPGARRGDAPRRQRPPPSPRRVPRRAHRPPGAAPRAAARRARQLRSSRSATRCSSRPPSPSRCAAA